MFQLARANLIGVGPPEARFDPLRLDFTGAGGDPVDTVLWLVNGGGKTVLSKLLFCVVRPDQVRHIGADRVESSSYRADVHPFVAARDTSHVMLEWHGGDGRRLVTGLVMEWRDGHVGDRSNLRRSWYSFTPRDGVLDLDLLDGLTRRDGHRLRHSAFVSALRAQAAAIELNMVVVADAMRRWIAHLDDIGLDPELFSYQLRMNRDEGGVEKLFQFRKDIDFIKFLLELVCDRGQLQIVSENLAKLAERVATQPGAELELDFVRGALAELEPLAVAEVELRDAEQEHARVQSRARRLHHRFKRRLSAETAAIATLEEEAADYERRKVEHGRVRRRAAANAAELNRIAAGFHRQAAEDAHRQAEGERDRARLERDAWRAVEPLARARAATAARTTLEEELAAAEQGTAPLAALRDAAASRFGGRLAAGIAAHRRSQNEAEMRARECAATARASDDRLRQLEREHTERALEQREINDALARLDDARLQLREDGFLGRGESIGEALSRIRADVAAAERRAAELRDLLEASESQRPDLDRQIDEWQSKVQSAETERAAALEAAERIEQEADSLRAQARLQELADGEEPDLDRAGQEIGAALAEAAGAADRRLIELEALRRDDKHALSVLEDGGLLPPSRDLEAALTTLEAASISASSGWHYLAHAIPLDQRSALLEHRPELAGAIVLADPHQRRRAEDVLKQAGLNPRSVLLVANSQELVDSLADNDARFAVPPDPALYDATTARAAKETLAERLQASDAEIAALETEREQDRALLRRLQEFLAREPFATSRRLYDRVGELDLQIGKLADHERQLRDERAALADRVREWRSEEVAVGQALRALTTGAIRLEALASDDAQEAARRARLSELAEHLEEARRTIEAVEREHQELLDEADAQRERAAEERAAAERLEREQSEFALTAVPADASGQASLEELRMAFIELDRAVREATSESELAGRVRLAREEEAQRLRECNAFDEQVLARAGELLLHDAASDVTSRTAAFKSAEGELERRVAEVAAASDEVKRRKADESEAERRAQSSDRRLLDLPEPLPADLEHAQAALEAETLRQAEETARETECENLERETRAEIAVREAASRDFAELAGLLARELREETDLGAGEEEPSAFGGTVDEARQRFRELLERLDAVATQARSCRDRVNGHVTRIQHFVFDPKFQPLATTALRSRLVGDQLPTRASFLASELRKRERVLHDSLEQIGVHKRAAVTELGAIVDRARQDLRAAERLSRLPDTLGTWGGKQFLRIDADWWESDEELQARLSLVVEELAHGEVRLSGIPLLVRALEGAVGRAGFRARLLKPTISSRGEYIAVTEAGATSSGGQGATLAILLYCSLCALRAHNRGSRGTAAIRSTLVLDNPIGKASADFLIEKQRAVAGALGVQLIYTTGVNDLGALDNFPKLIRLRNDQELRQNLRYVHLDAERIASLLGGRNGNNGDGYLAAAHLFER